MDCMMTSRPAKRKKQTDHVIQDECSRSTQTLSVLDARDPNFSLIPPHTSSPYLHYRPLSLTTMKEWGFGLPRMMDGFHGEYEVRCEMPLALPFILSLLRQNEDEERGI